MCRGPGSGEQLCGAARHRCWLHIRSGADQHGTCTADKLAQPEAGELCEERCLCLPLQVRSFLAAHNGMDQLLGTLCHEVFQTGTPDESECCCKLHSDVPSCPSI